MTESQFKEAFLPLYRQMYGFALTLLGNSDDAADVVQEVMARMWRMCGEIPVLQSPKAYALTAVRNYCLTVRRRPAVEQPLEPGADVADPVTADSSMSADSTRRLIARAIASMRGAAAEVMSLSVFEQCSNAEIEQITGLSAVNVRVILSRGRKELREILRRESGF